MILVVFAAAGVAAAFAWMALWEPPRGEVVDGTWYALSFPDVGREFGAIGWYVVIGLVGGVVLGLLAALLATRAEIATLVAVAAGSAVAGLVTYRVGAMLAPPDPTTVTPSPDGLVDGTLVMAGSSWFAAWPLGAIAAVFVVYLLTTGLDAGVAEARSVDRAGGLSRTPTG